MKPLSREVVRQLRVVARSERREVGLEPIGVELEELLGRPRSFRR
jgi:hypothetical protein